MEQITSESCPYCGGNKSTKIGEFKYRCNYCDNVYTIQNQRNINNYEAATSDSRFPDNVEPIRNSNYPLPHKSRTTAALLAFFLGGFGIHYFYLGNKKAGIIFCIVGLLGITAILTYILAIISGIKFLTIDDHRFEEEFCINNNWF